jgi:hypothetical protein
MGRNHIRKNPMMLISEKIRMLRTLQVERKGCLEWLKPQKSTNLSPQRTSCKTINYQKFYL